MGCFHAECVEDQTYAAPHVGWRADVTGRHSLGCRDIEFNTDVLDLNDRTNIDLRCFSRSGFILPGTYTMLVQINGQALSEQSVAFYPLMMTRRVARPACPQRSWRNFGLKAIEAARLTRWKGDECLDLQGLPGAEVSADLATSH